ncbi:S8 family serine peptidase, partial [Micromonospora zhanjiangensis]
PPAVAAPKDNCAEPGQVITQVPWPQQMFGPERIWPFAQGRGITVAVLDSGVDGNHPQLRGHVSAGFDATGNGGPANTDCTGTGTRVAGVIAAQATGSGGFSGLAPGVTILPVRVTDKQTFGPSTAEPAVLARGIDAAVARGAKVVAISTVSYSGSPALQESVAKAQAKGVILVAAVGDLGDANGGNPQPYPAGYDGVIGVGAIGPDSARWQNSQHGDYVDLVAPGADVLSLQRGRGMAAGVNGTGVACGFVAATVALTRAKRGDLDARELIRLLFATATPAAGGDDYGHGIVNPYAALNDQLSDQKPVAMRPMTRPADPGAGVWARSRHRPLIGTSGVVAVGFVLVFVAIALPRGRRRFWRSTIARPVPTRSDPTEPGPPL